VDLFFGGEPLHLQRLVSISTGRETFQ
jgi:hypothetical protein